MTTTAPAPETDEPETPAPARPRPPRVFSPRFSTPGLMVAALFLAISLQPSLLPRAGYVQGIACGITMAIGYGLGAGGQALWNYLGIPVVRGRAKTIGRWVMIGLPALTFVLLLVISRSLRLLFRTVLGKLGRALPRRLAIVLGVSGLLLLFWLLISGLLVNGFFAVSNVMFSSRDGATSPGIEQPQSALRSGSPESLVAWDELGRQGRSFVATGPTVAELDAFSGGGAVEPIRAYVGLKSADTLQERADLLLEELKRTGAFDREALIIATTTGTGFLDPNGVDPVEFIFNGDSAIAGVQYSYLPSWISLLADQQAVKETSRVVFDTIHGYWSTLPEDSRPKIYLYGLSLGSYGVESVLNTVSIINEPISGAFMSGPPFVNDLHTEITTSRNADSPEWRPVYRDSTTVRFTAEEGFAVVDGPWGETRIVYLQHGSDPVVFFSPSLAWQMPTWLNPGERAPDVSERMNWFPLVTFWQVALDLPGAGNVPWGYGHMYSLQSNTDSWVTVTNPEGWTPERTAELVATLEAREQVGD